MAPKNAKDTKNRKKAAHPPRLRMQSSSSVVRLSQCVCTCLFAVDVISALKAFETTLRAASRHKGVAVPRPLLEQLQQCQEKSQPLSRIILTGIHSEQVAAVVDCLASYSAVKSLICLNCCVGDKVRGGWWPTCRDRPSIFLITWLTTVAILLHLRAGPDNNRLVAASIWRIQQMVAWEQATGPRDMQRQQACVLRGSMPAVTTSTASIIVRLAAPPCNASISCRTPTNARDL